MAGAAVDVVGLIFVGYDFRGFRIDRVKSEEDAVFKMTGGVFVGAADIDDQEGRMIFRPYGYIHGFFYFLYGYE